MIRQKHVKDKDDNDAMAPPNKRLLLDIGTDHIWGGVDGNHRSKHQMECRRLDSL